MSRPGAAVIALVLLGGVAHADDGVVPPKPNDHLHQFALGLQVPIGVRAIITYNNEWCGVRGDNGSANATACIGRTPFTLDFEPAFGVKANLELMMEVRVGLERDFGGTTGNYSGPRLFQWAPGVRFYFSEAGRSKLFSTAQLAFDFTGYDGKPADFFLRNVNGFQLDLDPSYGLYFFVGEEAAFRRWFDFEVEGGIGIQGRYP